MGGYGSGRKNGGGKAKTEDCLSLDVNRLNRHAVFAASWLGGWCWSRGDRPFPSITIRGGRDTITLTYRCRPNGTDWESVEESVPIAWRPCRFGGHRPYFLCPGIVNGKSCNRNVAMLYCVGRYFVCRHCNRLTYAVRSEDRFDRARRRANKARVMLGGKGGVTQPLADRPKGMWQSTYERITQTIFDAEEIADESLTLAMTRILKIDQGTQRPPGRKEQKRFWT